MATIGVNPYLLAGLIPHEPYIEVDVAVLGRIDGHFHILTPVGGVGPGGDVLNRGYRGQVPATACIQVLAVEFEFSGGQGGKIGLDVEAVGLADSGGSP